MAGRQIKKWSSIIHSEIKSINKSKCPIDKQQKIINLYFYMRITKSTWIDEKPLFNIMRNKTHELWQQEPLFRKGLEEEIKYYKWKTCGHITKNGTPCKKPIKFGDVYCCIHKSNSNWDFYQYKKTLNDINDKNDDDDIRLI